MIQLLSNIGLVTKAHAATLNWSNFNSLVPTFRSGGDVNGVKNIIALALNTFLVIVFIIAFIYLVLYGIKYITSGGDAAKATEARNGIINAIIGIIVVTLAFFIIRFATSLAGTTGTTI